MSFNYFHILESKNNLFLYLSDSIIESIIEFILLIIKSILLLFIIKSILLILK